MNRRGLFRSLFGGFVAAVMPKPEPTTFMGWDTRSEAAYSLKRIMATYEEMAKFKSQPDLAICSSETYDWLQKKLVTR